MRPGRSSVLLLTPDSPKGLADQLHRMGDEIRRTVDVWPDKAMKRHVIEAAFCYWDAATLVRRGVAKLKQINCRYPAAKRDAYEEQP